MKVFHKNLRVISFPLSTWNSQYKRQRRSGRGLGLGRHLKTSEDIDGERMVSPICEMCWNRRAQSLLLWLDEAPGEQVV